MPVVPSPGRTPCREQLKPQCPTLEPWSGSESSGGGPTTTVWPREFVVGIETGAGTKARPTSKRRERGWSRTKRICWGLCQGAPGAAIWPQAVPGTTGLRCPRDHRSGFFSAARRWSCWGGHRAPRLPSPRSAAAPGAAKPQRGVGRGQGGFGSRRGGEKGAEGSSSPAEVRTPRPSPAAPREPARHPWARNRALGCTTVIKCGSRACLLDV